MFQPARPSDRWSRVANCLATSKGSLNVVLMVPVSPIRSVTPASAASTVKVSGRPDHVEVVDAAAVLAQPQPFGEEEEVEQPALGGAGEVHERVELDLAARRGIGPHRGVVDPGKVGGQMNRLAVLAFSNAVIRLIPTAWRSARGSAAGPRAGA